MTIFFSHYQKGRMIPCDIAIIGPRINTKGLRDLVSNQLNKIEQSLLYGCIIEACKTKETNIPKYHPIEKLYDSHLLLTEAAFTMYYIRRKEKLPQPLFTGIGGGGYLDQTTR